MKVVYVVGHSGTGKTLLCRYLVRRFRRDGFAVGAVKHASHGFELDARGKDTWRLSRAGASLVSAVSRSQVMVVRRLARESGGLTLALRLCREAELEAVVVEGFKSGPSSASALIVTADGPADLADVLKAVGRAPTAVATLRGKSRLKAVSAAPVFSLKTERNKIYGMVSGTRRG